MTAVSCGTPTPATMRVVQIEPGPDADLHRVRAGVDQRLRRLGRGDVAGDDLHRLDSCLMRVTASSTRCGMAVGGVDHDDVARRRRSAARRAR